MRKALVGLVWFALMVSASVQAQQQKSRPKAPPYPQRDVVVLRAVDY